jgi:tripartite-type tricarboxylate transporter receptor subunit TctC
MSEWRTAASLIIGIGMTAVCAVAAAQAYPSKPIRFVIPYPPGGASDVTARIIGAKMTGSGHTMSPRPSR